LKDSTGYGRKKSQDNLRFYNGIGLVGIRKTTINLSYDTTSQG
jgi:hypothetical protein